MYTDDTVLFFSARQVSIIEEVLSKEISEIEQWMCSNSLFINVPKTETVLFGTIPRLSAVESFVINLINVGGAPIKHVSQFKYLGVVFDERLSWNEHV